MSELADETDSKSVAREGVWVQVPPSAPIFPSVCFCLLPFCLNFKAWFDFLKGDMVFL